VIVVIGGGLTGLALGYQLERLGVAHRVLEADDRPGGVIRSGRVDGQLLDWGPQRTRLGGLVGELVGDLGLEGQVVTAPPDLPLFVYRDGRLRTVPFSASAFLRSDIVGWGGKLRLLAEPLTAGPRPGESVADFLSRKVGRELYENMLGPLYGGLYASDPADMRMDLSLGHVLREFGIRRSLLLPLLRRGGRLSPPPACSFREGMQTLTDALHAANRANVGLGAPVIAIRGASSGYLVETEGETIEANRVVVSVPAPTAAAVLREIAPDAAARIARLVYNPLAVVHLHAETELRGLGYQISFAESLLTRGVTFNDSLFHRRGVYTAYLGGARAPEIVGLPDEELAAIATREFRQVTGYPAEALSVRRERMPAWDLSWEALQGMTLPPGVHVASNWESRPGVPGRLAQAKRLAQELTRT
jgi:oxygen-dependent protoporphyrinogen oxidase